MAKTNNNPGITDDDIKKTKEYSEAPAPASMQRWLYTGLLVVL